MEGMKMKWIRIPIIVFFLIAVNVSAAGPRDDLWSQVDDAIDRGLPQTAIAVLDQIIPGALQDQAHAEATKAICLRAGFKGVRLRK